MSTALRPPPFVQRSELLRNAYSFAAEAHHGPRREGDTNIGHPVEVARLLSEAGFSEAVVVAALLHDVVEDTRTEPEEIERRHGPEVALLVREMTEDERIQLYERRKTEHRDRVRRRRPVAAIYAADKLATTRALNEKGRLAPPQKLRHFRRTLEELRASHPNLPFLAELGEELAALDERAPR